MATTTQGTQDEENKQKYNTICDGHHNMQTKQDSGNIGYKWWTQTKQESGNIGYKWWTQTKQESGNIGYKRWTQTKQESGNIGYKRWTQTKHKHNIMRVGHHNMQTKTNKVNKTWVLLQTTGGKDESNIVLSKEIVHSYHMIPRKTLHIL